MPDQEKGLYNKYQIINRETGQETVGAYFVLKPATDQAARAALKTYALVTDNKQLASDIIAWVSNLPDLIHCDLCCGQVTELSRTPLSNAPIRRFCRNCWSHYREAHKGIYGEDIGPFKPIEGGKP